jgi:hypothetical protein
MDTSRCYAIADYAARNTIQHADLRAEGRLRLLTYQRRYLLIGLHFVFGDMDFGQFVFQFSNPHLKSLWLTGSALIGHGLLLLAKRLFWPGIRLALRQKFPCGISFGDSDITKNTSLQVLFSFFCPLYL